MDRDRAETHLRLLAEAELRRVMKMPMGSIPDRWYSARHAHRLGEVELGEHLRAPEDLGKPAQIAERDADGAARAEQRRSCSCRVRLRASPGYTS